VGGLKPAVTEVTGTVFIATLNVHQNIVPVQITPVETHFNINKALLYVYMLGVIVSIMLLTFKLYEVFCLTKTGNLVFKDGYKIIYINKAGTAFSFFNYLFISREAANQKLIISHEQVHIRQKHSLDILLLEIFKAINWFNPVIYLLQNSLKNIHEYIADEKTATHETDAFAYSDFLVNNAYGIGGPAIAHSFFNHNLLKKRIIMLHQKRSGSLARLKYLITLPLCAGLLCASTLGFSKNYAVLDLSPAKISPAFKRSLEKKDSIYLYADRAPEFPGGLRKFEDYVVANRRYPQNARKNKIQGIVIIGFVVEKDGSLSNIKVMRGPDSELNREALRIVNSFPRWIPAYQNHKPVRVRYSIPIHFSLINKV